MLPGFFSNRPPHNPDLLLRELKSVVIDFETTGLYPAQGDEIVELGGIWMEGPEILHTHAFQALVNPGRRVSPEAFRVHGISDTELATQPPLLQLLPAFMTFIGDRAVVGQNIAFDLGFLTVALERFKLPHLENVVLDTRWLSRFLFPSIKHHSLDAIATRMGLSRPPDRHRAMGDVLLTAQILSRQLEACEKAQIYHVGELLELHERIEGGKISDPSVAQALQTAFEQKRRVRLEYVAARQNARTSSPEQREVEIYYMSPPYFLGYCYARKSIRTFRLDRVAKAQGLEQHYEVPESFDPRDHFQRWTRS